VISRWQTRWL